MNLKTRLLAALAVFVATATLVGACTPAAGLTPEEQLADIVSFVERARGRNFITEPVVEFLSDGAFQAEVLANLDAEQIEVDNVDVALPARGWITPQQNLFTEYRKAFGTGVVGFYDPVSKALKVRGTAMTPYRREIIAHELTHALDDQIHDMGDVVSEGLIDEDYLAALVAVEGSAERVRKQYFDSMSPLEQLESINEQLSGGVDPVLLNLPVALLTITSAPYLRGPAFQQDLFAAFGTPGGADQSLIRYPANTEQAFDSAKYLANEGAVSVATPPSPSTVKSGQFGPFPLSLLLREGLVLDSLDPVTSGWSGGEYVSWTEGPSDCIRIDLEMDGATENSALQSALNSWALFHPGAVVECTSATGSRVTSCA